MGARAARGDDHVAVASRIVAVVDDANIDRRVGKPLAHDLRREVRLATHGNRVRIDQCRNRVGVVESWHSNG